jgi:hypothetical protein
VPFNEVIDRLETHLIVQALERTSWNKNRAAQLLGLNRTTLIEKIKKKKLEPGDGFGADPALSEATSGGSGGSSERLESRARCPRPSTANKARGE